MTTFRTVDATVKQTGAEERPTSYKTLHSPVSPQRAITLLRRPSAVTSRRMSRVKQHGTAPELVVRNVLFGLGLRYRTSNRDLPGSPDLANRSGRWAVFVHGCFWHRHEGCARASVPRRNAAFWQAKFQRNVMRDAQAQASLKCAGWRVFVVWECAAERSARTTGRRIVKTSGKSERR